MTKVAANMKFLTLMVLIRFRPGGLPSRLLCLVDWGTMWRID